jgi:hypothetical protein
VELHSLWQHNFFRTQGDDMTIEAIRFRAQDNLVILQVLSVKGNPNWGGTSLETWRDATVEDLLLVAAHCKNKDDTRLEMLEFVVDSLRRQVSEMNQGEHA